jgi:hypothetical protein
MGLDIHISTDKDEKVYDIDFYRRETDLRYKMSLIRDFCNLMSRPYVATGTPEFNQIAELSEVNIEPIIEMESYWDEESAEHQISLGKTEEERLKISNKIQSDNDNLIGNIDIVWNCIANLIDKLSKIDNLANIIVAYGDDAIDIEYYFSDFNIDKGDGYIGNNFGQDLRNFKRFLEYAKSKGATTVFFNYG